MKLQSDSEGGWKLPALILRGEEAHADVKEAIGRRQHCEFVRHGIDELKM
jgi:hypothetical protein